MFDLLESIWDKITSGLLGIILDAILYAIAVVLYYIEAALGEALDLVYKIFDVFVGASPIQYQGHKTYLLNVFFENTTINVIYRGMMLIGIVMLFAFTLIAIGRKMFDSTGERVKLSYGMILTNTFKGALFMICMTLFMNIMVLATSTLLDSVKTLFDKAKQYENPTSIEFDDEDYANMFRVLDTIANYSLDPGYTNRYNLNTCFNVICNDMQTLEASGVFKFDYSEATDSWQYALYQIYMAGDIDSGMAVDVYNESLNKALLNCINNLKYNPSFKPLSSYERNLSAEETTNAKLGTILLLASSMNAANNVGYNGNNASITDALRFPYYTGVKNIYNRSQVEADFTIELGRWDHITALFGLGICLIEFVKMVFQCISRIFNMIILYIVSPGFISALPLDDGGKLKQWTTSFIIQCFSIFGNYIAVRLLILFIPIVMSNSLVMFDDAVVNMAAKDIFIVGLCITAQKASGMIAGILADNAGMSSVAALDSGSGVVSRGQAFLGRAASATFGAAKSVAGGALGAAATATGLSTLKDKFSNMGKSMRENYGLFGGAAKGFKTKDEIKEAKAAAKEAAAEKQDSLFKPINYGSQGTRSSQDGKPNPIASGLSSPKKMNSAGPSNISNNNSVVKDNNVPDALPIPTTNYSSKDTYRNFNSNGSNENNENVATENNDNIGSERNDSNNVE